MRSSTLARQCFELAIERRRHFQVAVVTREKIRNANPFRRGIERRIRHRVHRNRFLSERPCHAVRVAIAHHPSASPRVKAPRYEITRGLGIARRKKLDTAQSSRVSRRPRRERHEQAGGHPCTSECDLRPVRHASPADVDHNRCRGQHEWCFRPHQRSDSSNKTSERELAGKSHHGLFLNRGCIERLDRAPDRRSEVAVCEDPDQCQQRKRGEERSESFGDDRRGVARGEGTQRGQPQCNCCSERFLRGRRNSPGDQRRKNACDQIDGRLREHHRDPSAAKNRIDRGEKCGIRWHSLIDRHQLPVDEQAVDAVVEPIARQLFVEFCVARVKRKMGDEIQPQREPAKQRRDEMAVGNGQCAD